MAAALSYVMKMSLDSSGLENADVWTVILLSLNVER